MTTSLATFQKDLDEVIKPILKEILQMMKDNDTRDVIEVASAKIISEIKKCHYNEKISDPLETWTENQIVLTENKPMRLYQYSYPNNNVGNEELGTGKNPNSISWPPK